MALAAEIISWMLRKHFKIDSACCEITWLDKDENGMSRIDPDKVEIACKPMPCCTTASGSSNVAQTTLIIIHS